MLQFFLRLLRMVVVVVLERLAVAVAVAEVRLDLERQEEPGLPVKDMTVELVITRETNLAEGEVGHLLLGQMLVELEVRATEEPGQPIALAVHQ